MLVKTHSPGDIRAWSDKFEWSRTTIINQEQQHYVPRNKRNSKVVNDELVMTAIREPTSIEGSSLIQPYSSSMFISQGQEYVEPGQYVESILKLPKGMGVFAAFWLLRRDAVWQKTEIDIMETVGDIANGEYHTAFHSHVNGDKTYEKHGGKINAGIDLTNTFNRYGAYVGEKEVIYYFNRKEFHRVDLHEHEFGLTYYMLLNFAVASPGTWAANGANEPYDWDESEMYCRGIAIYDSVPKKQDLVDAEPDTTYPDGGILISPAGNETLYKDSPRIAQLYYDLAREHGGKF